MKKRIVIFPVNIGERVDFMALKETCLQEDTVHLLVNDIDFFKKVVKYAAFGISIIETEYKIRGGNFCSRRGCGAIKKPLSVIDEADYRTAVELLPSSDYTLSQVAEYLSEAPKKILLEKCAQEGIALSGAFTERKFRNRVAWIRKRDKCTKDFIERGLINEKKIPLCKGIIAVFNHELQQQYHEIHYVIPVGEKDVFENGLIATRETFGLQANITFSLYAEKEPATS
jgi:hypothetical protein